jgi:NAD(P)-dependent dehydrogenase (short-subunit alcohol dehydrogenase family)
VVAAHGRIDAVVAAAGWGVAGPVELTAVGEAKAQLETNFWGCVRVVQAALPPMRAQGGGRLVLISSIGGVLGIPFQAFSPLSSSGCWLPAARRGGSRWARQASASGSWPSGSCSSGFSKPAPKAAWASADAVAAGRQAHAG